MLFLCSAVTALARVGAGFGSPVRPAAECVPRVFLNKAAVSIVLCAVTALARVGAGFGSPVSPAAECVPRVFLKKAAVVVVRVVVMLVFMLLRDRCGEGGLRIRTPP